MLRGTASLSKWNTIVCKNGVIAAWHPQKKFPYEHSQPIDLERVKKEKEEFLASVNKKGTFSADPPFGEFGPKHIDLREIFYTPRQEWQKRTREERLYAVSAPLPKRK